MAETKKYLDYDGLKIYHEKAKNEYDGKYALKGETSDVDLSNYISKDTVLTDKNGNEVNVLDTIQQNYAAVGQIYRDMYSNSGNQISFKNRIHASYNYYLKNKDKDFALKSEVVDLDTLKQVVAEAPHIKKEKVETLPPEEDGVENVLYLVPRSNTEDGDYFDQYLLIDGKWDPIGTTKTNLANYFTKDEAQAAIDKAVASVDIESISSDDIDLLFKSLPEGYVPYPANGLYPSPDNFLRVWAGEELIAEIESPTEITKEQFYNKQVTRAEIPNSVTSIEDNTFKYNSLTSVTIPDSVTSIGAYAFQSNQLTSLTIPDSVTSIGVYAFGGNPLETVSISRKTKFQSSSFPETAEIIYRD